MYSLDDIIDGTGGPPIVSEQHDLGAIDWVAGLSDPGEMIACGYMPEARRQDGESDEDYAQRLRTALTPEQYAELARVCAPAAIRRASLDTTTGKVAVMVAGRPPWHKLGVNVAEAVKSADAMRLASLAWSVEKIPHTYTWNGQTRTQSDSFALVRSDTGAQLGVVGSRYRPIQNADAFGFLDELMGEFDARYETAGAVYGGKRVWMLVHLPKQAFTLAGNDKIEPYCLFENPHDGSGVAHCHATTERPVCANTLRMAWKDRAKGISIRHTGDVRSKINDAREALHLAVDSFGTFREAAEAMSRTKLPVPMRNYANDVLDAILDITAADAMRGSDALAAVLKVADAQRELEAKRIDKLIETRGAILDDILTRHEQEKNATGDSRGTVWSAFNAVTESADHRNGGRKVGTVEAQLSRKMESILTGDRDQMKQVAYAQATAFVRS